MQPEPSSFLRRSGARARASWLRNAWSSMALLLDRGDRSLAVRLPLFVIGVRFGRQFAGTLHEALDGRHAVASGTKVLYTSITWLVHERRIWSMAQAG